MKTNKKPDKPEPGQDPPAVSVTGPTCPNCATEMQVRKDGNLATGLIVHYWYCPDCGYVEKP